jgi:hypothetical protein
MTPVGRAPQWMVLSLASIAQSTFFSSDATGSRGSAVWNSLYVKALRSGPQPSLPMGSALGTLVVVIVHSIPSATFGEAIVELVRYRVSLFSKVTPILNGLLVSVVVIGPARALFHYINTS